MASVYISEDSNSALPMLYKKKVNHEMDNLIITESIVKKKLLDFDINKECGPDQMHPHLLKGDNTMASNYRPVSLTSVVCKTMETFVCDHVSNFMNKNDLFSNNQNGFLSKRSTVLRLLNIIDKWSLAVDESF